MARDGAHMGLDPDEQEKAIGIGHAGKEENDCKFSVGRKSSVAESIVAADLLDERFATTQRGLKSRHAQMIALGGTIGTGLFVGSGQTLALGGPAFILVCYILMTGLVYCIVTAITEVATYLPVHGGTMSYYGYRYVSRSMGFATGYLYWYLGVITEDCCRQSLHLCVDVIRIYAKLPALGANISCQQNLLGLESYPRHFLPPQSYK